MKDKWIIQRFADDEGIAPGDMFLLNDPYVAAIHQSDVYLISPIHHQDLLVGWSATFVHVMDIGAMSPGGNSPGAGGLRRVSPPRAGAARSGRA